MAYPIRIPTGAPGIYKLPDSPLRAITGVRMDVCAFVGVAPRGPANVPVVNELWPDDRPCLEAARPRQRTIAVAIESFDQYRRLFGGFEGPGLLPYSVAAFFEQGGRRAYVCRIVPSKATENQAVASGYAAASGVPNVKLNARNEGSWGNGLQASLEFVTRPLEFTNPGPTSLTVDQALDLPAGTLLRLTLNGGQRVLSFVIDVTPQLLDDKPGYAQVATLDPAVPGDIISAEIAEGVLSVDDGDGRFERHERQGLSAAHPRWMGTVLCYESELVYPDKSWIDAGFLPSDPDLLPPPAPASDLINAQNGTTYTIIADDAGKLIAANNELAQDYSIGQAGSPDFPAGFSVDIVNVGKGTVTVTPSTSKIGGAATLMILIGQMVRVTSDGANYVAHNINGLFTGGIDRYPEIVPDDCFDSTWTLGDAEAGNGVHAVTQLSDLSLLVVPDLYSPAPLPDSSDVISPVSLAGPEFQPCVDPLPLDNQADRQLDLDGLRLDPSLPGDLEKIVENQKKLQELAELMRSFIVLLDVPPGLNQRQILKWRGRFDSAFVAAYHPWLRVSRRDDARDALVTVPPSAVAAGIIAKQELAFGVPHGPANVVGAEVVTVDDVVSPARHDELHPEGVNVYLRERDGIRLTAARTLSRDRSLRQLSVRRLLTMIRRALEQQMQWAVFEPNNEALRLEVRLMLQGYLRQLFRIGAFRGATDEQAFFVRCDETNNPPYVADAGRLIADIGIAPSEPLEFIVLSLSRGGDGTLTIKEKNG